MLSSRKNRAESAKTQTAPVLESLESRQMMSASLASHSTPTAPERPVISASLKHAAKPKANVGGAALAAAAAGKAVAPVISKKGGAEPNVTVNGLHYANFASYPLFSSAGPSINDINQGGVGDCYFMSAIAEEAAHDPARLRSLVRARGDGTFDVYFYNNGWVDEHVDGYLPVTAGGQLEYAGLGQGNSIWVAIMEKGFTYFRAANRGQAASYSAIDTGTCAEGLRTMGLPISGDYGQSSFSTGYNLAGYVYGELTQNLNVELMTSGVSVSGGMVTHHAYAIISAYQSGGTTYIEVRNPWGRNTPGGQPYIWYNANTVLSQMADVVIAPA